MSLLTARPSALLAERYDRLAIACFGLVWVAYAYIPDAATVLFRAQQAAPGDKVWWLWVPATATTLVYVIFPAILHLDRVWKLLLFGLLGGILYATHTTVAGFGIIDLSWFALYYGSLGLVFLLRIVQRRILAARANIEANLHEYDPKVVEDLKSDWTAFLSRFIQVYLAVAAVLGVCMSILLSGSLEVRGQTIAAWQEWDRMTGALRMAGLFIMESALYLAFFLAPLLEHTASFQDLLLRRRRIEPDAGAESVT